MPSSITTGQTAQVSLTFHNTGATTWSAGSGYALGSQNPTDNQHWGMNRVTLPQNVTPDQTVMFNFTITA